MSTSPSKAIPIVKSKALFVITARGPGSFEGGPCNNNADRLREEMFCGIKEASKRETIMPKVCEICQKGPVFGHNVSHSHKSSPKKWKPNLQSVKAVTSKGPKQIWVCTRCIRSGKVVKVV
jgi:large subunit ribosomal protein L28